MGGFGLRTDDCRATHDELVAKGVDFVQPPSDRPYGVEAVMRDNSGNWLVLVEPRVHVEADFAGEQLSRRVASAVVDRARAARR